MIFIIFQFDVWLFIFIKGNYFSRIIAVLTDLNSFISKTVTIQSSDNVIL